MILNCQSARFTKKAAVYLNDYPDASKMIPLHSDLL